MNVAVGAAPPATGSLCAESASDANHRHALPARYAVHWTWGFGKEKGALELLETIARKRGGLQSGGRINLDAERQVKKNAIELDRAIRFKKVPRPPREDASGEESSG